MKSQELKDYWNKVSKEIGLPDSVRQEISRTLEDPKRFEAFNNHFIPRPEVDNALDTERKKTQAAFEKAKEFDNWAHKEALPEIERLAAENERLQKYARGEDTDDDEPKGRKTPKKPAPKNPSNNPEETPYVTRDQLAHAFDSTFGAVELINRYELDYGKPMNVTEFRKMAQERFTEAQKEGRPASWEDIYQEFTQQEREASEQARIDDIVSKRVVEEKAKFMKDYSDNSIPGDVGDSRYGLPILPNADEDGNSPRGKLRRDFVQSAYEAAAEAD